MYLSCATLVAAMDLFCLQVSSCKIVPQIIAANQMKNLDAVTSYTGSAFLQKETRRLAACTQAVVITTSTSYIAIELKCFAFEVVRNSIESMC